MGWNSSSGLMSNIIETVEDLVSNYNTRVELYKQFITHFEDMDADTLDECVDDSAAYKEAYESIHGDLEYEMEDDEDLSEFHDDRNWSDDD